MLKSPTSTDTEKSGTSSWGSNLNSEETKRSGCFCGSSKNRKLIRLRVLICFVFFFFTLLRCVHCALLGREGICRQLRGGGLSVAALNHFFHLDDSALARTLNLSYKYSRGMKTCGLSGWKKGQGTSECIYLPPAAHLLGLASLVCADKRKREDLLEIRNISLSTHGGV